MIFAVPNCLDWEFELCEIELSGSSYLVDSDCRTKIRQKITRIQVEPFNVSAQ